MYRYLLILFLFVAGTMQAQAQVAVVAHKSVPVDALDAATLESFYNLDTNTWSDGSAVTLLDQKSDTATKSAFYEFIGGSAREYKKVWLRKKLSGEGRPPNMCGSDAEVLQKVASTPGAVGYVSASSVTDDVKVIATN